jgi:arginyl-tRNA synthetase
VKLSKRKGDIILLREDVIDEVGPDATRFTYLMQSIDTKLLFDLDVVVQRSMDNPVFYVQMAHARLAGIARNAAAKGVTRQPLDTVDLTLLIHQREQEILTILNELPDVVADAADRRAPNKVTTWSRELASAVHGFHHDCWVVADDVAPELSQARLWLVEAARIGLVVALDLLGVAAPDQM